MRIWHNTDQHMQWVNYRKPSKNHLKGVEETVVDVPTGPTKLKEKKKKITTHRASDKASGIIIKTKLALV